MRIQILALSATLALLSACTGYTVHRDYDLRTDFQAYKTYDWTQGKGEGKGRQGDSLLHNRVSFHVDQALAARGFRLEKKGDPDFLVAFTPVFRNHKVRTTTSLGVGVGFRVGPFRVGSRTAVGETRTYPEGSIILEILDYRSRQLVWEGRAEGALSGTESAEEADEKAGEAVKRLLEAFPPRGRK